MPRGRKKAVSGVVSVFDDKVSNVLAKIRSKYGDDAIIAGNDLSKAHLRKFPFDVFVLDTATGGGVPRGRVSLLIGAFSSGKSTLAIKVAASAQKRCRFCDSVFKYLVNTEPKGTITVTKPCKCGKNQPNIVVYGDIEHTFDEEYARALGFEPDIALIAQNEYAEKSINIMIAMLQSGEVDLLILDSIAALTPTVEAEDGAEKWQQGLGARLVNKFMRAITSSLSKLGSTNEQKPAVLLINQKREKIGVFYGDPTTLPYGKGQEFTTSLTVDLTGSSVIRVNDQGKKTKEKGEVIGRTILWKIKKNKITGRIGMAGEFELFSVTSPKLGTVVGGVNNDEQIVGYAKLFGLVEQGGAYYTYGEVREMGLQAFVSALHEAKQWVHLKREVANALLISGATEEGDDA